ncbi:hypothetical protein FTX61_19975 [Nitriliruptoraceae bacterium ZYF776]|nr:hypothetical protein [Profundirhabdus halotolerans]
MDGEAIATSWLRWVTTALVATALAVVVRTVAALLDVEVVVPDSTDELVPLEFGPIVVVTLGVSLVAVVAVVLAERLLPGRARGVTQLLAVLVLLGSMVPLVLAEVPRGSLVVLVVLHLVVGVTILRGIVRDA